MTVYRHFNGQDLCAPNISCTRVGWQRVSAYPLVL